MAGIVDRKPQRASLGLRRFADASTCFSENNMGRQAHKAKEVDTVVEESIALRIIDECAFAFCHGG